MLANKLIIFVEALDVGSAFSLKIAGLGPWLVADRTGATFAAPRFADRTHGPCIRSYTRERNRTVATFVALPSGKTG